MASRLAAWLVTGPVGHLCAGLADAALLLARVGAARLRARVKEARGGG